VVLRKKGFILRRVIHVAVFVVLGWLSGSAESFAQEEQQAKAESKPSEDDQARTIVIPLEAPEMLYVKSRNVTVLPGESFSSGEGVPSMVSEVPGVFLQKTNVGAGSPLFRGRVGIENAVRIDGLRYGNASFRTGPNQYLNVLGASAFESGMVVLGAGGTQFGGGATGGAVLLHTHRRRSGEWGNVSVTGNTGSRSLEMSALGGMGGTSGYGFVGASIMNSGELRQAGSAVAPGTDYERMGAHMGLGTLIGDTGWSINMRLLRNEIQDVTRIDQLGRGRARNYDNGDWFGYVDARGPVGERQHGLRFALMFQETEEAVNRWSCDKTLSFYSAERCARHYDEVIIDRQRNEDRVLTLGGKSTLDLHLWEERWDSTIGAEVYHDEVLSSTKESYVPLAHYYADAGRGNFQEGTIALDWSLYWMNELNVLESETNQISLLFGSRLEGLMAHASASADTLEADYSYVGAVGELGVSWTMNESVELFAVGASGFRPPNFQETSVLGDTGTFFEVPNPDLAPEDIYSVEIGVAAEGWMGNTGISGHMAWVVNSIDRLPSTYSGETEFDGLEVRVRENVGQSRIYGVEWYGKTRSWNGLGVFGDLSWLQMDVERDDGVVPGRRETPMNGKGGVYFYKGDVYATVFSRFALEQTRLHPDDKKDDRICEDTSEPGQLQEICSGSPGWATLNLSVDTRLSDTWRWSMGIDNITDHEYRLHGSGFDAGGTQVWSTATASF
jgi:hemoglobin/transferrin/lactoferrin receptor protein